ncbi:MAG: transposase [Pseudomonadota bacterium]
MVIAVDSTGLSLLTSQSWNRHKHNRKSMKPTGQLWHKLHIAIDTQTGQILSCKDTTSSITDGAVLPELMDELPTRNIQAVCADKAYDRFDCRKRIKEEGAHQRIPPTRDAVHTDDLKHRLSPEKREERQDIFAERDAAIAYFKANMINGSDKLARQNWKKLTGYHERSLVETTMWQLKAHTTDQLRSKKPLNMAIECRIKCKIVNLLNAVA